MFHISTQTGDKRDKPIELGLLLFIKTLTRRGASNSLSPLEEARLALFHLIDGRGGGEEGVVGGVEGGGAAVALLHRQRTGTVLQRLRKRGGRKEVLFI